MTNNWQEFLEQRDALYDANAHVTSFGESPADYPHLDNTLNDLGNLGIVSATGPDSRKFLQGQASCDVLNLAPGHSTPGAICNPKGRMLTYFQACFLGENATGEEQLLLSMDKTLVAPTLAHLEKYAAFFKTTLADSSEDYRQFGVSGSAIEEPLLKIFPAIPAANTFVTDGTVINDNGSLLGCITAGLFIIIVKINHAQTIWEQLSTALRPIGLPWWQLQMIRAGQASLTSALSEQLVPQMLNLQATGAISFSKGCYTGQEVVARMEYLGKLKRRMYLLSVTSAQTALPVPGTDITDTDGKLLGTVVQAAPSNTNHFELLAVLREAALDQTELLFEGQAMSVVFNDLPYELTQP